jgi:hypothetical protein
VDFHAMKSMDRWQLLATLRCDYYFGTKSWNELQVALDGFHGPWFEFCL